MGSSSAEAPRARRFGAGIAAVVAIASLAATTSCRRTSRAVGERASEAPSTRVVSLSPSTTEALFAIGGGKELVGRSRYCNYPPEVAAIPQVGGYIDPNFEAILALRPTFVTGARGPAGESLARKLEDRGVTVFFPPTETFEEIDAMLLALGDRTNHAAEAQTVVSAMHDDLRSVEIALEGRPKVRVLLVFGLNPLSVAGPASFADEMLRRAGGVNVVTEGGAYPILNVERVLTLDPDVIVDAAMAEAQGKPRITRDVPGFRGVRAVAEGRVRSIDEDSVLRPGPRVAEGVRILSRILHPEVDLARSL